jgi:AbrB family looped-hinge helix DNA binding protein
MSETVTLSSKGQVVIPLAIREQLQLQPGAKLFLEVRGKEIVLSTAGDWQRFRGSVRSELRLTDALLEERRRDQELEDRKLAR